MYMKRTKEGQILLVVVLFIAIVLTIILSISFKSQSDTQLSTLEKEQQKTLAAAEAAIEVALRNSSGSTIQIPLTGVPGFTGAATVETTYDKDTFVSPLLQKDEQYTFYLSDYPGFTNPYTGSLTLYYGSGKTNCNDTNAALEISILYNDPPTIKRFIADTKNLLGSSTNDIGTTTSGNMQGVSFGCSTTFNGIDIPANYPNAKIMLVRTLAGTTKLGFKGSTTLKPQGKIVTSEATSNGGVSKKVEVFQSYPQLPAEFFVTSFSSP
jgi:type II secretory pathway pseudopilin PulG